MKHTKAKRPDFILSIPVVILLGFGMVMVYSASGSISYDLFGDSGRIFFKQLVALCIGLPLMVGAIFVNHELYRRKYILYCGVGIVFLLLLGVLFQDAAKGAQRWFNIFGFGFQPSVLATVVTIMFVAAYATAFAENRDVWIRRLKVIVPFLVVFSALILAQNDFGTTMIILCIAGIMLYLAGIPIRILVMGGLLLLPIMVGLVVTKPYRIARIKSFLTEDHYQIQQSKMALGSGGMTGVGLGQGNQKQHYLPEAHTDFIYATLGEELGLIGTSALLLCYLFFLCRGVFVLCRVDSQYSRILGAGLLLLLTLQAMLNISVTLGLFPNKGLTLPFISAGGTSLMISLVIFGIILNISRFQVLDNRVVQ